MSARSFRLTQQSRGALASRLAYHGARALEEHGQLIDAYLDTERDIGRADAAALLGLSTVHSSRILSKLSKQGRLAPVANRRGAGVRYRRA